MERAESGPSLPDLAQLCVVGDDRHQVGVLADPGDVFVQDAHQQTPRTARAAICPSPSRTSGTPNGEQDTDSSPSSQASSSASGVTATSPQRLSGTDGPAARADWRMSSATPRSSELNGSRAQHLPEWDAEGVGHGIVATHTDGELGEIVGAEAEERGVAHQFVGHQRGPRRLDHGAQRHVPERLVLTHPFRHERQLAGRSSPSAPGPGCGVHRRRTADAAPPRPARRAVVGRGRVEPSRAALPAPRASG